MGVIFYTNAAPPPRSRRPASSQPAGTSPIYSAFPKQVRNQLKIMAVEQIPMHNLVAEALNDLFAKYGKPEIVPRSE